MATTRDQDDARDARRILDRVARQAEAGGAPDQRRVSSFVSTPEAADPIEILGTRIGRALGLVLTIGLVIGLIGFVVIQG